MQGLFRRSRLTPLILLTGAEIAEFGDADHVFLGALAETPDLSALNMGSDLYPDDGATVVIRATLNEGSRLRVTGPGVDGEVLTAVGGLPEGFWARRRKHMRYPMGFDLFLINGAQVIGLPRSAMVEAL